MQSALLFVILTVLASAAIPFELERSQLRAKLQHLASRNVDGSKFQKELESIEAKANATGKNQLFVQIIALGNRINERLLTDSASIRKFAAISCVVVDPFVVHTVFDPKEKPKIVPPNLEGWTRSKIAPEMVTMRDSKTNVVSKAEVVLTCVSEQLLASNATETIKAHEEGHVKIAQLVYKTAPDVVARIAKQNVVGKAWDGGKAFDARYDCEIPVMLRKVNAEYDRITAHGANNIAPEEAVDQAWKACVHP